MPACLSACPASEAVLAQRRAGVAERRRGAARKAERAAIEDIFASVRVGVDVGCVENACWTERDVDDKAGLPVVRAKLPRASPETA